MKFDVIIGNPPYQLSDGGAGASAKPIYQLFVQQAKRLKPRYLVMITPSRWFAGGKGLDAFRDEMIHDNHIRILVDYINAKDCFPDSSIGGGVNYFLWDRDNQGNCKVINITGKEKQSMIRRLDEYPIFIRTNQSLSIIHKVQTFLEESVSTIISSRNPYGLTSATRGGLSVLSGKIKVYSSESSGYIEKSEITRGLETVNLFKVMISKVISEHAGEPDKAGQHKVLSRIQLLEPGEVCTDSYLVAFPSKNRECVINFLGYLQTRFCRFLLLQAVTSINLSKEKFIFVPRQDFSKPWTDAELYAKYGLTEEEITFIESMIKPMD